MSVDLKNTFRLSLVTGETELPIPAVSEILARLRSGPVWGKISREESRGWGSNWPHPTETQKPDDAILFDLMARWAPDESRGSAFLLRIQQRSTDLDREVADAAGIIQMEPTRPPSTDRIGRAAHLDR